MTNALAVPTPTFRDAASGLALRYEPETDYVWVGVPRVQFVDVAKVFGLAFLIGWTAKALISGPESRARRR